MTATELDTFLWKPLPPPDTTKAVFLIVDGGQKAAMAAAMAADLDVDYIDTNPTTGQTTLRAKLSQYGFILKWWAAGCGEQGGAGLRRTMAVPQ